MRPTGRLWTLGILEDLSSVVSLVTIHVTRNIWCVARCCAGVPGTTIKINPFKMILNSADEYVEVGCSNDPIGMQPQKEH